MVYKLLLNPNLVDDPKIKKIFIEGKKRTKITDDFSVECLVTSDWEYGLRYVELKHFEKGYKGWGESERNNFIRRRGRKNEEVLIKTEIDKRVKELNIPPEIKDKILGHGYITTFYRVTTGSPAKEFFGYEIKGGRLEIKDINFNKKLKVIIWNLLNKKAYKKVFDEFGDLEKDKLNSRTLNKSENVYKYLKSITDEDVKRAEEEISRSIKETYNIFGEKTSEIQLTEKKQRKTPVTRQKEDIFGRDLALGYGPVNDLYLGICLIYNQNKDNYTNLKKIYPILGMSLRLILEVAAREYFKNDPEKSKKDGLFIDFLNVVKSEFRNKNEQEKLNYLSLASHEWLSEKLNLEAVVHKWAHGNLPVDKTHLLSISYIVGDILDFYFGINKK